MAGFFDNLLGGDETTSFFGGYLPRATTEPTGYYNYGVMAAKAGYGRDQALQNAGLYNRIFGGEGFGANGLRTLLGHPPSFDNRYGLNGKTRRGLLSRDTTTV